MRYRTKLKYRWITEDKHGKKNIKSIKEDLEVLKTILIEEDCNTYRLASKFGVHQKELWMKVKTLINEGVLISFVRCYLLSKDPITPLENLKKEVLSLTDLIDENIILIKKKLAKYEEMKKYNFSRSKLKEIDVNRERFI